MLLVSQKPPYSTNRPNPIFSSDTLSTYTSTEHKIHQINLPHIQQDNSFSRHVSSFFTVLSRSSNQARPAGLQQDSWHHGTMSTSWHGALVASPARLSPPSGKLESWKRNPVFWSEGSRMWSKNKRKIRRDPRSFSYFSWDLMNKTFWDLNKCCVGVPGTSSDPHQVVFCLVFWVSVWQLYLAFYYTIIRKRIRPIYTSNMYSCTLSRAVFAYGKPQVRKLPIVRGGRRREQDPCHHSHWQHAIATCQTCHSSHWIPQAK